MMFKNIKTMLVLCLLLLTSTQTAFANNSEAHSLILYEMNTEYGNKENTVEHLKQLLYAFNEKVDVVQIEAYTEGLITDYDYVFVMNIHTEIKNDSVLTDLVHFNGRIYWIGNGIQNYLTVNSNSDLTYTGSSNQILQFNYQDQVIYGASNLLHDLLEPSSETQILATMSDGYNTYPYILNEKNLFFISRYKVDEHYIFEDSLFDFFEYNPPSTREVFVRIEDVHPFRDPQRLKEIADYLFERNIPFMIALVPAYVDNNTHTINTLDQVPEFVEAIQYMQERGGSVILHGYTHQLGFKEVTGEGYEFWDIENDTPIENIETYIQENILTALRLCVENEIYPLAFEAPHYAMDANGYLEIKKYFSTYVGHFQNNNINFTTSSFPYRIYNSDLFNIFIPENLGYIEADVLHTAQEIIEKFNQLQVVRSYTGGFFFFF
ncbi:MAG TPA: hypothetical protein DCY20_05655 [Firmicutes bacterium]|nr:hypothetical protein [Bacillota bacterium]